jgi:hypothetical protein
MLQTLISFASSPFAFSAWLRSSSSYEKSTLVCETRDAESTARRRDSIFCQSSQYDIFCPRLDYGLALMLFYICSRTSIHSRKIFLRPDNKDIQHVNVAQLIWYCHQNTAQTRTVQSWVSEPECWTLITRTTVTSSRYVFLLNEWTISTRSHVKVCTCKARKLS